MTAYRTQPTTLADRPYVNEYLERALVAYYRKGSRLHVTFFGVCVALTLLAVAYVLLANPEDGWLSKPVGFFGLPGFLGMFIFGGFALASRKRPLLDMLRTGIAIRGVRRTTYSYRIRINGIPITKTVPMVVVDFSDGRASTVQSSNDPKLTRIEELLRIQMAKGSAGAIAA